MVSLASSAAVSAGDIAFPPGSTVQFKTIRGGQVQGQVVCFDASLKVLSIKDTSSGKPIMRIFNLSHVSDIKELSAPVDGFFDMFSTNASNPQQIMERVRRAEQMRRAEMMEVNVPLEGQKAFVQLKRTLDVVWKGADIIVLGGRVVVAPPYSAESAVAKQDDEQHRGALAQVKKILSKPFVAERGLTACSE